MSDDDSQPGPGSEGRQNGGGLLMAPGKGERRTLPKRKPPGKDGMESDEEGGLLVVQHGQLCTC